MQTVEPENYQVEAGVRTVADIKPAAHRLFDLAKTADALLRQHGSIYRCEAEYRPSSADWLVRFEISPDGEKGLTVADFELEIRRMLKAHL